ncbi:carbohydrate-binding protein [Streptomyces sp. NPDC058864]
MTAGNNGAPEPGSDDPFAYLYRQDGEEPGQAAAAQPGVPRTSYNQVQRVGERRPQQPQQQPGYGYPQQQPGYGQQPPAYGQQPPAYGQPQPQHAQATQQMPQGPGGPAGPAGGPGRRAASPRPGGPNSKSLLIGAVAVVAAVAIGIGVAMAGGDDDTPSAGSTPTATASSDGGKDDTSGEPSAPASAAMPGVVDAADLKLAGGATVTTGVSGGKGAGGKYVAGMESVGASATWNFSVPEDGAYTLFVEYTVPGADGNATITVNGEKQQRPMSLKNFAQAKAGDYEGGWTKTYSYIRLKQGENTVALSCEAGNQCNYYLDQVSVEQGEHKN